MAGKLALSTKELTKNDVDALGVSHDSLSDVSADDHHPQSHNVASHSDTTATGAELETLTDNSIADALHRHSELVASDGAPDPAVSVDAIGQVGIGTETPAKQFSITKCMEMLACSGSGVGVLYKGTNRFMHDYKAAGADGCNLFLGENAGNFSMAISGSAFHASYNTGIGGNVLQLLTTGYYNVGLGKGVLCSNTTGHSNIGIGTHALSLCITGACNVAIGRQALERSATSSNSNVAIGYRSGLGAVGGVLQSNVLIGYKAGYALDTGGNNNICIGALAGDNITSGEKNIIIGYNLNALAAAGDCQLSIGNLIFGDLGATKKVGVNTSTLNETLSVGGAIRLGTSALTNAGTIRWTGADFEGYTGAAWASLTSSGYTNLTEFVDQTAWRLFYSNTDGDVIELVLGTSGQYLKSNGIAVAPTWDTPADGDVIGPATNTNGYIPVWNGADSKTLANGIANNSANWNTAFGWGDHAGGGYLTTLSGHNVTELDDVSNAGSGSIISSTERTKLSGIENGATTDQTGNEIVSLINAGVDLIDDNNIAASIARDTEVNAKVSDIAYAASWNGVTTIAPSKNAIYDKIETMSSGIWTDEGTYCRPNNVTNSGNTGHRIYDAGYTKIGQVSPTTGNNFGGGSCTDGTVLRVNHGNSGSPTADGKVPLWVKRYVNKNGTDWGCGAAYFGAVKTGGTNPLHTVVIDTYCQGGSIPAAGGVLGSMLIHLKNDTCTAANQDIHNIQMITYTPSSNYQGQHCCFTNDVCNRYGSKGWLTRYAAGWTNGFNASNESTSNYDNSVAYSMGTGTGGGRWYIGYECNSVAYDASLNKGEGIYFQTSTFDTHADCLRAEGNLDMRSGYDIALYHTNSFILRTGRQNSYTDRMWITNAGNMTLTGTLTMYNNKAIKMKDNGGVARSGFALDTNNDWWTMSNGRYACIGANCSQSNPVLIRINGNNNCQLIRSPDIDSNGKHYVTLV